MSQKWKFVLTRREIVERMFVLLMRVDVSFFNITLFSPWCGFIDEDSSKDLRKEELHQHKRHIRFRINLEFLQKDYYKKMKKWRWHDSLLLMSREKGIHRCIWHISSDHSHFVLLLSSSQRQNNPIIGQQKTQMDLRKNMMPIFYLRQGMKKLWLPIVVE